MAALDYVKSEQRKVLLILLAMLLACKLATYVEKIKHKPNEIPPTIQDVTEEVVKEVLEENKVEPEPEAEDKGKEEVEIEPEKTSVLTTVGLMIGAAIPLYAASVGVVPYLTSLYRGAGVIPNPEVIPEPIEPVADTHIPPVDKMLQSAADNNNARHEELDANKLINKSLKDNIKASEKKIEQFNNERKAALDEALPKPPPPPPEQQNLFPINPVLGLPIIEGLGLVQNNNQMILQSNRQNTAMMPPEMVGFASNVSLRHEQRLIQLNEQFLEVSSIQASNLVDYPYNYKKKITLGNMKAFDAYDQYIASNFDKFELNNLKFPNKKLLPPPQSSDVIRKQLASSINESTLISEREGEFISDNSFEEYLLNNIRLELAAEPEIIKLATKEPADLTDIYRIELKKINPENPEEAERFYNEARKKFLKSISFNYNTAATALYTLFRHRLPPTNFVITLQQIQNTLAEDLIRSVGDFVNNLSYYEGFGLNNEKAYDIIQAMVEDLSGKEEGKLKGGLLVEFKMLFHRLRANINTLRNASLVLSDTAHVKSFFVGVYSRTASQKKIYFDYIKKIRIITIDGHAKLFETGAKPFSDEWFKDLDTFLKSAPFFTNTQAIRKHFQVSEYLHRIILLRQSLKLLINNENDAFGQSIIYIARFNELNFKLLSYYGPNESGELIPVTLSRSEQVELTTLMHTPEIVLFNQILSASGSNNPLIKILKPLDISPEI